MAHLILLGDSIFDNGSYCRPDPAVIDQVRIRLPKGWTATLVARDGSVCANIPGQLASMPKDASHLVLSIGGNDALGAMPFLEQPADAVFGALHRLAEIVADFCDRHSKAVMHCQATGLPLTICTIYDGRIPDPGLRTIAATALATFNDAIIRTAFRLRLPLIDLRLVCSDDGDYANPIEPSSRGGAKIAESIVGIATRSAPSRSEVWW